MRLGLTAAVMAAGIGMTVALDRPATRPTWQMAFITATVLMPILALQTATSRAPFVAWARGSAGPLLWLTLAATMALIGVWVFCVYQSDRAPENGALLFLPAALLVPAMLGAPGPLDEAAALSTLGEAFLVGGAAVFVGSLAPARWRPIAGGVALGAQFVLLWALGRGPVLGADGGTVVPLGAALLLAVTALLTVLTPLAALFSRRFFQIVETGLTPSHAANETDTSARRVTQKMAEQTPRRL